MAFGDEENDFAMLRLAKVSVAMDNAIPSIKQVATHSTKSNQQDGVAVFLEKYFD
jgi:hydroxymethylpyrimidine pyrophosphatase-like HAD family hydrolase